MSVSVNVPVGSFQCNISIVGITAKHCFSHALYINANIHIVLRIFLVIIVFHCKTKNTNQMWALVSIKHSLTASLIFTVRCSYTPRGPGSHNFVRLSVTCVLGDKTKQCTADIFIPHEMAIILVVWHPFHLKFALKVTHTHQKTQTSAD